MKCWKWKLLALVQFDTLTPFLLVVLGLGAAQFLIGNVLEPVFMGRSLNLSSFMILASLTFWGSIWGVIGMFLSVPITVIAMIIFVVELIIGFFFIWKKGALEWE